MVSGLIAVFKPTDQDVLNPAPFATAMSVRDDLREVITKNEMPLLHSDEHDSGMITRLDGPVSGILILVGDTQSRLRMLRHLQSYRLSRSYAVLGMS